MTAFATVAIGDFSSTYPVPAGAVNFVPSLIDANGVAHWYKDEDVLDARPHLSMSVRLPAKGSQVSRVQAKLVLPMMDADDATLKIGECLANLEFVFPKRSTEAQRLEVAGRIAMFLFSSPAYAAVSNLESIY
jgi:hypothetical protein